MYIEAVVLCSNLENNDVSSMNLAFNITKMFKVQSNTLVEKRRIFSSNIFKKPILYDFNYYYCKHQFYNYHPCPGSITIPFNAIKSPNLFYENIYILLIIS